MKIHDAIKLDGQPGRFRREPDNDDAKLLLISGLCNPHF